MRPEREDLLVSINPEYLLLEGARRIDEWSLIEKKIPSLDLIFELDPRMRASGVELSASSAMLPLIDGKPRRAADHRRLRAGGVRGRARRSSA